MGSVLSRRARRGFSLKERDFVTAAKALGGKDFYVLLKHVVPNTFASVTVIATLLWPSSSSRGQPEFSRSRRAGQHSNLGLHVERGGGAI